MTHTDQQGNVYREVGPCPYSELTPGTPFLLPGDPVVYFRSERKPPSYADDDPLLKRLCSGLLNTRVIVLELVEKGDRT
jgi:hypothetical protein